jgi:phosphoglycolate phosphatase-like HAD superfamily hydrolase
MFNMPAAKTAPKRVTRRTKAAATKAPAKRVATKTANKTAAAAKRATKTAPERSTFPALTPAVVKDIVRQLKAGTTMTDIRAEFGQGAKIRKALTEAGYNTKGEKIEVEAINGSGKTLATRVARAREAGKAWYSLEIATGKSETQLKDLLTEHGFGELAEGRVIKDKPEPVKRTARAAKATTAKTARVGRTKTAKATATAAKPIAKPKARRVARRKANPSSEG